MANNIKRMAIILGLIFIVLPWINWGGFFDNFELPKVLVFLLAVNLTLAYVVPRISSSHNIVKKRSQLDTLLLLLLGWLLLASIINGKMASFVGQYYRYQGIITWLGYLEWYWIMSRVKGKELENYLPKLITAGGILLAVLIILESIGLYWFDLPIYSVNGRVAGMMGNPNFAGAALSLSAAFAGWPIWPLLVIATFLTGSRSALLALGIIIAGKLVYGQTNRKLKMSVIIATGLLMVIFWPKREGSFFDKREVIWTRGIEAIIKKPIFGWGPENFETAFRSVLKENDFDLKNVRVDKAHNELVEMGVAGGLPAAGLYLLIIGRAGDILWKKRNNKLAMSAFWGLVGWLVISQLNVVNVNSYILFYTVLGLAAKIR